VLFQNAFEAAALVWTARIPERIGFNRDARGFLLTKAIAVPRNEEIPAHQRFYYLELLKRAGLITGYADAEVVLSGSAAAAVRGRGLLEQRGVSLPAIGVSPGAAYGMTKRWLPDRFAAAAVQLGREYAASVAVFGSRQESSLGREVAATVSEQGVNAISLAGLTSLGDFIDMAAACSIFLTNDSGSMHIASALGIPTVAVFGPTESNATGPAGHAYAIVQKSVPCAPCKHRECPIDHRCMTGVTVEEVVDTAKTLLR
jgi:heptosyltransferase-2